MLGVYVRDVGRAPGTWILWGWSSRTGPSGSSRFETGGCLGESLMTHSHSTYMYILYLNLNTGMIGTYYVSMYVYIWLCINYRTDYPILSRNMSSHINISNLQPRTLQVHRRSANVDAAQNDGRGTSWVNARWSREKGSCFSRHHFEIFWAGGLLGSVKSPVCIRFLTMVAVCIAIHRGFTGYADDCVCVFFVLTSILRRS